MTKSKHYLRSRDMTRLIHEAKTANGAYLDPAYHDFDVIITDPGNWRDPLRPMGLYRDRLIRDELKRRNPSDAQYRTARINRQIADLRTFIKDLNGYLNGAFSPYGDFITPRDIRNRITQCEAKIAELESDLAAVAPENVVYRVLTFSHIPVLESDSRPRHESEMYEHVNGPPFQHLVLRNGRTELVGQSHWTGDLASGKFKDGNAEPSPWLFGLLHLLVERIALKPEWRAHPAMDDLKQDALLHLLKNSLKFNEHDPAMPNGIRKTMSSFSYATVTVHNSFRRALNRITKDSHVNEFVGDSINEFPDFDGHMVEDLAIAELDAQVDLRSATDERL